MLHFVSKTYGQYCGVAKALDHIGDRWTLLIVRELLVNRRRYSEIRYALPGIATNLLATRLRDLELDGLVEKLPDGRYDLTAEGRELEPIVHALVRWGGRWMRKRGRNEEFRPEWLVVALRALLPKRRTGKLELHVDGSVLHVDRGRVDLGPIEAPDAVVEAAAESVLAVAAGEAPLSRLKIHGKRGVVAMILGVA